MEGEGGEGRAEDISQRRSMAVEMRSGRLDLVDDALLGGELLARGPEVGVVGEELELCAGCERWQQHEQSRAGGSRQAAIS